MLDQLQWAERLDEVGVGAGRLSDIAAIVEERTGLEENHYEMIGMKVPHIELYVRPGRDIAGFRTGAMGLGHAVLTCADLDDMAIEMRQLKAILDDTEARKNRLQDEYDALQIDLNSLRRLP